MVDDKPDFGPDFVRLLIYLTDQDKLIWQEQSFGKGQDSSLAYANPWMFCLDTDGRYPVLQVARHYNFFTELQGGEHNLGALDLAISRQYHRRRMTHGLLEKPIAAEKIKKFSHDKALYEIKEHCERMKILGDCALTLRSLTGSANINNT